MECEAFTMGEEAYKDRAMAHETYKNADPLVRIKEQRRARRQHEEMKAIGRRRLTPHTSCICAQTMTAAKRVTTLMLTDQDPGEAIGEAITGGACGASGIEGQETKATEWIHLPLPTPVVQHLEVEQLRKQEVEKETHRR